MQRVPRIHSVRGFTLVELIVSVGLFTVVVVIAMSAYLSLIALDRKARATNDIMTNLSFVMESMTRSIRTGTNYNCGGMTNCSVNGASSFSFVDENLKSITYLKKSDCGNGTGCVVQCIGSGCGAGSATTLTDPRVNVTNLTFYTLGVGSGDGLQPRVTFIISGSITPDTKSAPVSFTIEGGATQRLPDI